MAVRKVDIKNKMSELDSTHNNKQKSYPNLWTVGGLMLGWSFGFKMILLMYLCRNTYYVPSRSNLLKLALLFNFITLGFYGCMMQFLVGAMYAGIYYRDTLLMMCKGIINSIKELEHSSENLDSGQCVSLAIYNELVSYYQVIKNAYLNLMNRIKSNTLFVQIYAKCVTAKNTFSAFNGSKYIGIIEGLLGGLLLKLKTWILKLPYIKKVIESYNNIQKEVDILQSGLTESNLTTSQLKEQQKVKKELDSLDKILSSMGSTMNPMMGSTNGNNQMQQFDIANLKPPTHEEIVQMAEIAKIFGQVGMTFEDNKKNN
jgi:hypothetical protein